MEWLPRSRQPILRTHRTLGYMQGRDRNRGEGPFSTGPFNFLSSRPFPTQSAFLPESRKVNSRKIVQKAGGSTRRDGGERKKGGG